MVDPVSPDPAVSLQGYAQEVRVFPGDRLPFMLSGEPGLATVRLARLIHGDPNPDGPGFKDEVVAWGQTEALTLQPQHTDVGSYLAIDHQESLNPEREFTLAMWFMPTLFSGGWHTLAAKWAPNDLAYALYVTGHRTLTAGVSLDGRAVTWCTARDWLKLGTWQFTALTHFPDRGEIRLYYADSRASSGDGRVDSIEAQGTSPVASLKTMPTGPLYKSSAQLLFGATAHPTSAGHWAHFNGKIARPVLMADALDDRSITLLAEGADPRELGSVIASWNLSRGVSGTAVVDESGNEHHGIAVNGPARAVTGPFWTGTAATMYSEKPDLYDAVHLHEDDLDDAGWEPSLELEVPADARSGIYSLKLERPQDALHVPFIVCGIGRAPLCYVVPTYTWQAYSTNRGSHSYTEDGLIDRGVCIYDAHRDGSMVYYVTRRRPTRSHHPSAGFSQWGAHNTTAGLYLIDWLEAKKLEYELQTDEDLHERGIEALEPYSAVILGSHCEYWSAAMLSGLRDYLSRGGHVLYLGGNGLYWVTSVDPARPHMIEVRKSGDWDDWWAIPEPGQFEHSTTLEPGGLWSRLGRLPRRLVGVEFSSLVFEEADGRWGFQRLPSSFDPRYHFVFEGVDDEVIGAFGLNRGSAAGYEMDSVHEGDWDGRDRTVALARATHDLFWPTMKIPVRPASDIAMTDFPGGGVVFAAGSVAWTGSLSHNDYDNNVSRLTENVVRRFISTPRGGDVYS